LDEVVTGGQTGADQGALRAARACGIPTGGWAPLGWLVETPDGWDDVSAPWLATFGVIECPEMGYAARTRANVRDSDATLWFGNYHTPGGRATLDACRAQDKPFMLVLRGVTRTSKVRDGWIPEKGQAAIASACSEQSGCDDGGLIGRPEFNSA